MEEKLISTGDAATMVNVSVVAIHHWIKKSKILPWKAKIGGRYLLSAEDVMEADRISRSNRQRLAKLNNIAQ